MQSTIIGFTIYPVIQQTIQVPQKGCATLHKKLLYVYVFLVVSVDYVKSLLVLTTKLIIEEVVKQKYKFFDSSCKYFCGKVVMLLVV